MRAGRRRRVKPVSRPPPSSRTATAIARMGRPDEPADAGGAGGAARTATVAGTVLLAVPCSWEVPATTARAVNVYIRPGRAVAGRRPDRSMRPEAPVGRVPVQVRMALLQRQPDAAPVPCRPA